MELRAAHNAIRLWTWGGEVCSLPKGATAATLRDEWRDAETCEERRLDLAPGDLLVLEEVKGPRTGTPGDADPAHRQAVRLTSVTPAVDRIEDQPVLEVTWAAEDALRFPLCLTTRGGRDCEPVEDVTLARGNVVLVDHGRSLNWCGDGLPETVTVPPVPAVVAPCDPPAFGCRDPDEGNAPARLINSLTDKAELRRRRSPPDDVRELFEVVGEDATATRGPRPGTCRAAAGAGRAGHGVRPGRGPQDPARPVRLPGHRAPLPAGPRPLARGADRAVPGPADRRRRTGGADRAPSRDGCRQRLVELWRSARDRTGSASRRSPNSP